MQTFHLHGNEPVGATSVTPYQGEGDGTFPDSTIGADVGPGGSLASAIGRLTASDWEFPWTLCNGKTSWSWALWVRRTDGATAGIDRATLQTDKSGQSGNRTSLRALHSDDKVRLASKGSVSDADSAQTDFSAWRHVVVTMSPENGVRLYENSIDLGASAYTGDNDIDGQTFGLEIGHSRNNNHIRISVASLRTFDHELTQAEVDDLYDEPNRISWLTPPSVKEGAAGEVTCDPGTHTGTPTAISYEWLDADGNSLGTDQAYSPPDWSVPITCRVGLQSANGWNYTQTNIESASAATGLVFHLQGTEDFSGDVITPTVGQQGTCDSASMAHIESPANVADAALQLAAGAYPTFPFTGYEGLTTWTLGFWARKYTMETARSVVIYEAANATGNRHMFCSHTANPGVRIFFSAGASQMTADASGRGGWHYYTVTSDSALFVNAAQVDSNQQRNIAIGMDTLRLNGRDGNDGVPLDISEVKFWSRVLTQPEIAAELDAGRGVRNHHTLQDAGGSTNLTAEVGLGAVALSPITQVTGPGGLLPFAQQVLPGIDCTVSSDDGMQGASVWTVLHWYRGDSNSVAKVSSVIRPDTTGWTDVLGIMPLDDNNGDGVRVYIDNANVINEDGQDRTGPWHLLALVNDGVDLSLYIDAVLAATAGASYAINAASQFIDIGHKAGSNDFNGDLSEHVVANYAMDVAEIQTWMQRANPIALTPPSISGTGEVGQTLTATQGVYADPNNLNLNPTLDGEAQTPTDWTATEGANVAWHLVATGGVQTIGGVRQSGSNTSKGGIVQNGTLTIGREYQYTIRWRYITKAQAGTTYLDLNASGVPVQDQTNYTVGVWNEEVFVGTATGENFGVYLRMGGAADAAEIEVDYCYVSTKQVESVTYEWQRDGVNTGNVGLTYLVQNEDKGATITYVETATNEWRTTEQTSNGIYVKVGNMCRYTLSEVGTDIYADTGDAGYGFDVTDKSYGQNGSATGGPGGHWVGHNSRTSSSVDRTGTTDFANNGGEWTVSGWFKYPSEGVTGWIELSRFGSVRPRGNESSYYINWAGRTHNYGTSLQDDKWHHLFAERINKTDGTRVFIDGQQVGAAFTDAPLLQAPTAWIVSGSTAFTLPLGVAGWEMFDNEQDPIALFEKAKPFWTGEPGYISGRYDEHGKIIGEFYTSPTWSDGDQLVEWYWAEGDVLRGTGPEYVVQYPDDVGHTFYVIETRTNQVFDGTPGREGTTYQTPDTANPIPPPPVLDLGPPKDAVDLPQTGYDGFVSYLPSAQRANHLPDGSNKVEQLP